MDEQELLERLSKNPAYNPDGGDNENHVRYTERLITANALLKDNALIVGTATGFQASLLAKHFKRVTLLDGSRTYLNAARARLEMLDMDNVTFSLSMIEDYDTNDKFDNIIFSHVIEHVDDPAKVLSKLKHLLAPLGQLHITCPNGESLHRQMGHAMGILSSPTDLTESDRLVHKRVYTWDSLERAVALAGFKVMARTGYYMKLFSMAQNEKIGFTEKQVEALNILGTWNSEIASEIYVCCMKTESVT